MNKTLGRLVEVQEIYGILCNMRYTLTDLFVAYHYASDLGEIDDRLSCFKPCLVFVVQAINIMIVNQSMIDLCASIISLLIDVIKLDGTGMSADSIYDQFNCRIWIARAPLWSLVNTSTYGLVITAFERYFAVIYPIWYNVRTERVEFCNFSNTE